MGNRAMSIGMATGINTTKPIPTITDINPDTGVAAGGTAITITGTNFQKSPALSFKIAGVPCTSVVATGPTTATAVTGPHAEGGPFDATVILDGVSATGVDLYTYDNTP